MSSEGRLSRKQKKAVATKFSPVRDAERTPLDDFELVHRNAMMDTRSLGLSQRLLVSESALLHRREMARTVTEAQSCVRDGQEGARDGTPPIDFVPICYYPGGIFEELPSLSPELLHSAEVRGQTWGNVLRTLSTVGSVKRLLRGCRGVGRPWSPPFGFQCVYESYFQDDTKLWFPICRLVTSYARRRDAAISQFLNGPWRLTVALMVMAAEIDVTLNVRAFEELTSVNPLDEGLWSVKMRPNYNVVKGYPNKTVDWQRAYFYIKSDDSAFEDSPDNDYRVLWNALLADHPTLREYLEDFLPNAREIARLGQERWGSITRDRIRRCGDRITRSKFHSLVFFFLLAAIPRLVFFVHNFCLRLVAGDWSSIYIPAPNTLKRRISLFTRDKQREIKASRGMRGLPDLSAMMASKLGLSRPEPVDTPSETRVVETTEAGLERQGLSPVTTASPSKKKTNKKRSRDDPPIREVCETSHEGIDAAGQGNVTEPPRARKKKQPSDGRSSSREEPTLNLPLGDDPADVSPPAPLQLRKRPKKTNEQGVARLEAPHVLASDAATILNVAEGPTLPTPGTSTSGVLVLKKVPRVVFVDHVSFEYDGPTPLIYVPQKFTELVSQIRGGPKSLPPVADLVFKDEYVDAARTKFLSDGSMNFVVEKYDAYLKEALASLGNLREKMAAKGRFYGRKKAEWEAAYEEISAKRERAIARRKIHQERANVAEADLRVAQSTISALEMRTGRLEEKIGLGTEAHKKELDRLQESRVFEVTKERVRVETKMRLLPSQAFGMRRALFDTMRLLQSQVFGTRKCLKALKAGGHDIPQEMIDMFTAEEKQFEEEALKLDIDEIPEADLSLSQLKLDSQFVDERVMGGLDPFGLNTSLISARTAVSLHTPSASHEHNAETPTLERQSVEENAALAPNADQSAILLLSDTSAEGQGEDQEEERSVDGR
ncbi:hypothetical protein N665_0123s0015 [Sinapis alba]|nr:hypothetical protein N665_0123s0015 [Sinapis alba]